MIFSLLLLSMPNAGMEEDAGPGPCKGAKCAEGGTCEVVRGTPACVYFETADPGPQAAGSKEEKVTKKKPMQDAAPGQEPPVKTGVRVEAKGKNLFIAGAVLGGILYGLQSTMSSYFTLAGPPMYLAANSYIYMMQAAQAMAMKQFEAMGTTPSEKLKKLYKAGWFFLVLSSLSAIGPLGVLIDLGVSEDSGWRYDVYLGLMYGLCMPFAIISSSVIFAGRRRLTKELEQASSDRIGKSDAKNRVFLSPQVTPLQGGAAVGIGGVF